MPLKPSFSLLPGAFNSPQRDMAWRSGGRTNAELVNNLYKNGLITTERVREAMLKVS